MAQRRLVILRHAKSAWPDGVADHDRPLAERGRRDAPAAGRWIAGQIGTVDVALCSPATRAQQTQQLAFGELGDDVAVVADERIYDATPGDLLSVVHDVDDAATTAVLVGHNPGLSQLVAVLTGEQHELKTAAIAVVTFHGAWTDAGRVTAELADVAKPRG